MRAYEPSFRPPDGAEILFVGNPGERWRAHGLYAVDVASGVVRTIIAPSPFFDLAGAVWSPDGSRIAYWRWGGPGAGDHARARMSSRRTGPADLELSAPRRRPSGTPAPRGRTTERDCSSCADTPPSFEDRPAGRHPGGWQLDRDGDPVSGAGSTATVAPTGSGRRTTPGSLARRPTAWARQSSR